MCVRPQDPCAVPASTILPVFNSCAFFEVKPNASFHAVQEVFADRPRMSIQGWYHAKVSPADMESATLGRLKSTEKGEDCGGDFAPLANPPTEELTDRDIDYLKKFINPAYLTAFSMQQISAKFETDSSIQLRQFLLPQIADDIKQSLKEKDDANRLGEGRAPSSYLVGSGDGWEVVGPAHKQRFCEFKGCGDDALGKCLEAIQSMMKGDVYARYMQTVTGLTLNGVRAKARRFRPGLDYTVAHYGVFTVKSSLDATLVFCAGEGKQCNLDPTYGDLVGDGDDEVWESGEAGGFECYIAAEEDEVADAEYDPDGDSELLSVRAAFNTLSLCFRNEGTMRFVKYVNASAPGSRCDVAVEFECEYSDSDDDDVDEDDEVDEDDDVDGNDHDHDDDDDDDDYDDDDDDNNNNNNNNNN